MMAPRMRAPKTRRATQESPDARAQALMQAPEGRAARHTRSRVPCRQASLLADNRLVEKPSEVRAGGEAKRSFAVPAGGLGPPITGQYRPPIPR